MDENTGTTPSAEQMAPGGNPTTPVVAPVADPATETPTTPAPAAPAAEPLVTPPAVEPPVLDTEEGDNGTVVYQETGDAALDVALSFLGNLGIAGTDPAMVAAANGKFELLEAKLAVLGDKAAGWPQMLNLAKDAFKRSGEAVAKKNGEINAAVLSVAGSAEAWASITAWASKNATPEEKASINRMIDADPFQARAAAMTLLTAYNRANDTVKRPVNPARDASGASVNTGPLSTREYGEAVRELRSRMGPAFERSPEYRDLQRRLRK